jgi:TonB family protein
MSNIPQVNEASPAATDRRAHPREKMTALAYVDLGPANGGMLLNLSEGGLALATATRLVGEELSGIHLELPDVAERVEVCGRVVWRGESKKEAGIKFTEVPSAAAEAIKTWISAQERTGRESEKLHQGSPTPEDLQTFDVTDPALPSREIQPPQPRIAAGSPEAATEAAGAIDTERPAQAADADFRVRSSSTAERRTHPRGAVQSLAYVDLGLGNGGRLLNLSESGLALTAVVKVMGNKLERLRFELPNFEDWVEAPARIIWRSESKKQAGVQFEKLGEEALAKIRKWISTGSGVARSSDVAASVDRVVKPALQPVLPDIAPVAPEPELPRFNEDGAAALASDVMPRPAVDQPSRSAGKKIPAVMPVRNWASFAAMTALVAVISFVTGIVIERRFREGPSQSAKMVSTPVPRAGGSKDAAPGVSNANSASKLAQGENDRAIASGNTIAPPSRERTQTAATSSPLNPNPKGPMQTAAAPLRTQEAEKRAAALPKSVLNKQAVTQPKHTVPVAPASVLSSAMDAKGQSSPTTTSENRANLSHETDATSAKPQAERANPQSSSTSPSAGQPMNTREEAAAAPKTPLQQGVPSQTVAGISPVAPNPASGGTPTGSMKEAEKPPSSPETANSMAMKPTITITMSPFPSLRIPTQSKPDSSRLGKTLEIGHLISRVEPTYPGEAASQRIEGTVTIHATIGRDGTIQSIVANGPRLLAESAKKAVLQWRYKPTLLGGQAIEADQDIVLEFRLAGQNAGPN